jgi:hypothetical protein
MRATYEQIFTGILEDGLAEGSMQVGDVSLATKALLQMCTGISYWYSPTGRRPIGEIINQYVELFFWGVCGKPEHKR